MSNILLSLSVFAPVVRWSGLLAGSTTATSAPAGEVGPVMGAAIILVLALSAAGLMVWVRWIMGVMCSQGHAALTLFPPRPNRLNLLIPLAIFAIWVAGQYLAGPLLMAVMAHAGAIPPATLFEALPPADKARVQILTSVLSPLVLIPLCLVAAVYTFAGGLRGYGLSLSHPGRDATRGLAGFLMAWPLYLGLTMAATALLERFGYKVTSHPLLAAAHELDAAYKAIAFLSAAVLAPVAEEMFFRGILQSALRRETLSPWTAILITSALFAVIHVPLWHGMPALFALAVIMGYLYEKTGRLTASITVHAAFNTTSFIVSMMGLS